MTETSRKILALQHNGGKLTKDVTKFPAEFQIQEFPR